MLCAPKVLNRSRYSIFGLSRLYPLISHDPTGRSSDAAEDDLAFDLALLDRVLVLAGRLRDPFGDVGVGLIDGDHAVTVQVGLPSQAFEEIVGEDPVAERLALLAPFGCV